MKRITVVFAVFLAIGTICQTGFAQGLIIGERIEDNRWGVSLPIKRFEVKTSIEDQVAVTEIIQVFHNPHNHQMEGTYVLPVPIGANISKFSMKVDGEQTKAEIFEKKKRRRFINRSCASSAIRESFHTWARD